MLRLRGMPFCTAAIEYLDHDPSGRSEEARIHVRIGAQPPGISWFAILDTAAPWCLIDPEIADALELSTREEKGLSTRLGLIRGELHRVPLLLFAQEGRPLVVNATVFASAQWAGPNIVGYQGFLERLRFAVDPGTRRFYFGKL